MEKAQLEAEKKDLLEQNNKLQSVDLASMVPIETLRAFVDGFEACQMQIARKFSAHGIDYEKLDACKDEPELEEEKGNRRRGANKRQSSHFL